MTAECRKCQKLSGRVSAPAKRKMVGWKSLERLLPWYTPKKEVHSPKEACTFVEKSTYVHSFCFLLQFILQHAYRIGVVSQIKFQLLIENNRKEQIETWPPLIKSIPSTKVFQKLGSIYKRSNTPMCQLNNAKNFSVMQGRTESSGNQNKNTKSKAKSLVS